jgi:hypothetical protein
LANAVALAAWAANRGAEDSGGVVVFYSDLARDMALNWDPAHPALLGPGPWD